MGASTVGLWEQAVKFLQDGTKDSASCLDSSLCTKVEAFEIKLEDLPQPPKAAWKKLVQQMQVPLHVGVAFSTAVQHNWKSPGATASLFVLDALLGAATTSGHFIKEGAAAGNLAISMRQQLQQAGVLQQLATVMAGLAADLRTQAASIAVQSDAELCSNYCGPYQSLGYMNEPQRLAALMVLIRRLLLCLRQFWCSQGQTDLSCCHAWLCSTNSTHAEAAMQLCTAALQYASTMLWHMLPAMQQWAPQEEAPLMQDVQERAAAASRLGESLAIMLCSAVQHTEALQGAQAQQAAQQLQPLLMSQHCVPFVASLLALKTSWVGVTCSQLAARDGQMLGGSSASCSSSREPSSSSSSRCDSCGCTSQHGCHSHPTTSIGAVDLRESLTSCQLRLFELLGLDPQLTAMIEPQVEPPSPSVMAPKLPAALYVLNACHYAVMDIFRDFPGRQAEWEVEKQSNLQRWRLEQQLWLLLPLVLLPCAKNLLLLADGTLVDPGTQHPDMCALGEYLANVLVDMSYQALTVSAVLCCDLEGGLFRLRPPHPALADELLSSVLQLADLLLQQWPQPEQRTVAAAASGEVSSAPAALAPTSSQSSGCSPEPNLERAVFAREVLKVLSQLVLYASTARQCEHSSDNAQAASALVPPLVAPIAERFVQVCTALEAGLRLFTVGKQHGYGMSTVPLDPCLHTMFIECKTNHIAGLGVTAYMGLCGPNALTQELRQFYSTLSTVLKLGHCDAGPAVDLCCWVAAQAALELLQAVEPAHGSEAAAAAAPTASEQAQSTSAAKVQRPEVEYLPSLVILGRCCLAWEEQLHQQSSELLLLASNADAMVAAMVAQQRRRQQQKEGEWEDQEQCGVLSEHSAARVCLLEYPEEEEEAASPAPFRLEAVVGTLSSWLGSITSAEANAALAAAAGGNPQQFLQQLEALAAAQQVVQRRLTKASLTELLQQLHATGVLLSSIAVPHFCNNPNCGNISGPTELYLVSGRSCLCAGCRVARYCGRRCQRQAWSRHKPVCKALAASADAQVSPTSG